MPKMFFSIKLYCTRTLTHSYMHIDVTFCRSRCLSGDGGQGEPGAEHSPLAYLPFCSLGFVYASIAGLMGALASVGAKLVLSAEEAVEHICDSMIQSSHVLLDIQCDAVSCCVLVTLIYLEVGV